MGRDTFHQARLLKAPSNLALNTAREGASTVSLGNLLQWLTTHRIKNFFLISNLNLLSFSLVDRVCFKFKKTFHNMSQSLLRKLAATS